MTKCIDASPLIVLLDSSRQYVIIGSHAGLLQAYQIDSGQLIWSFQTKDRIEGSAALSRDGHYVLIGKDLPPLHQREKTMIDLGDYSGMLYIIDAADGNLFSSYQCDGLIKSIPCVHASLDIVYVGAHDQFLHAIQLQATSTCLWKYGLQSSCVSSPQLSADNHRLFVGSLNGDVFALQADNGQPLWKSALQKPIFSSIAIWNEKFLIVGCVDQNLYCLDCDNGIQVESCF